MSHLQIQTPIFKDLGLIEYSQSYDAMLAIVSQKADIVKQLPNQFWFLEHKPVFTQGIRAHQDNTDISHIHNIPLINTDRGGLITYHGPGQLTIYALCHLNSKSVRAFVDFLEEVVINILKNYDINANRRDNMPGVYTGVDKIASIGLRVKNGMSYHGISLNVNMDLTPFHYINPCGYEGLKMSQISDFIDDITLDDVKSTAQSIIHKMTKTMAMTDKTN